MIPIISDVGMLVCLFGVACSNECTESVNKHIFVQRCRCRPAMRKCDEHTAVIRRAGMGVSQARLCLGVRSTSVSSGMKACNRITSGLRSMTKALFPSPAMERASNVDVRSATTLLCGVAGVESIAGVA